MKLWFVGESERAEAKPTERSPCHKAPALIILNPEAEQGLRRGRIRQRHNAGAYAQESENDPDGRGPLLTTAVQAAVAPIAALLVAWLVGRHAVRRVGGLTGDVLGALCEIATTVCLLVLALNPARIAL